MQPNKEQPKREEVDLRKALGPSTPAPHVSQVERFVEPGHVAEEVVQALKEERERLKREDSYE